MVEEAEKKIGYKLPRKLIEILRIQNGGYMRYQAPDSLHRSINGIGPYFPSLTDFDWKEYEEFNLSFDLNGLVPFDGDGHWHVCLDYRENKENPKVSYVDTETDWEEVLADDFNEYLESLVLDTENNLVVETDKPIENIVDEISKILQIHFEAPDFFDQIVIVHHLVQLVPRVKEFPCPKIAADRYALVALEIVNVVVQLHALFQRRFSIH